MKIAFCTFPMNQIGGALPVLVDTKSGFEKNGHQIDIIQLLHTLNYKQPVIRKFIEYVTVSGVAFKSSKMYYGNEDCNADTKQLLSQYDMILFHRPCPTTNSSGDQGGKTIGTAWQILYDIPVPKYVMIHDAWYERYYKWMDEVANKIEAAVCIHYPSWHTTANFPGRRIVIPYAINFDPMLSGISTPASTREESVYLIHVWKKWNYGEIFLQSIPHIYENCSITMAGSGVEYYYMSGKKRKESYRYSKDHEHFPNMWYWETALEMNNVVYAGAVTTEEKFKNFKKALISPSLSYNPHFPANVVRANIEAIACGSICIVYGKSIGFNLTGVGGLIKPSSVVLVEEHSVKGYSSAINRVLDTYKSGIYDHSLNSINYLIDLFADYNVASVYESVYNGDYSNCINMKGM